MSDEAINRIADALEKIEAWLHLMVQALERLSPPVADRSTLTPADEKSIIRTPLRKLAQWEREEHEAKTRIG